MRTKQEIGVPVQHMPQLDGLRGIAILLVMVGHFIWPLIPFRLGLLGVRLFFVLSGFLITGILLRSRDGADLEAGRWFVARQFYVRRFLRIFPVYYLTLFLAAFVLHSADTRAAIGWHLAYVSNFYFSRLNSWVRDGNHFWSLATEEQFYLFWPWVVLGVRRRLLPLILLAIGSSVCFRAAVLFCGYDVAAYTLLPSCLDSLGLGALLALVRHDRGLAPAHERLRRWALRIGGPCALAFVVMDPLYCWLYAPKLEAEWVLATRAYWLVPGMFAVSLFFVWLVDRAADGFAGRVGRALQATPMVYFGRISYGLYLFHPYAYRVVELTVPYLPFARPHGLAWNSTVRIAVSLALASLSWSFFEKPLNGLKRRFAYPGSGEPPALRSLSVSRH